MSTDVLHAALCEIGDVDTLAHETSLLPSVSVEQVNGTEHIRLGTQPLAVHGEALLARWRCRRRLAAREYALGWAVNSRYAAALATANIPYVIWEPTTIRDELLTVSARAARRAGRGTGIGRMLHAALLPLDERLEGRLYRRAEAVLAMSAHTRRRIIETHRLKGEHVDVLHHPPSPAFLDALARLGGAEARPPRRAGDPLRMLFVGRVDDPRKNFALLLHAYADLRAAGAAVSLSVVGPFNDRWRRGLASIGGVESVTFHGEVSVEQLAAAYLANDLLVLPSRQEGFGIVVAEALHAGVAVVSTPCGGPEQVIRASRGGYVAGFAREALAATIRQLTEAPEAIARCSALGVAFARRELSAEWFARRVADVTEFAVCRQDVAGVQS